MIDALFVFRRDILPPRRASVSTAHRCVHVLLSRQSVCRLPERTRILNMRSPRCTCDQQIFEGAGFLVFGRHTEHADDKSAKKKRSSDRYDATFSRVEYVPILLNSMLSFMNLQCRHRSCIVTTFYMDFTYTIISVSLTSIYISPKPNYRH